MSSCTKDFLDTDDLTHKNAGNYYRTPADAQEALTGCYDALQLIYADGIACPLASDIMSDLCFAGTGAGDADNYPMIDEFDKSVSPSDQNLYEPNWEYYYVGIFRVNTLLMNLDNIDWSGDESQRDVIEAEAKFLRAYFYFDMVRLWEKVPLLTEPTRENIPQSEPDDTYELITTDLIYAAEHGRSATYGEIVSTEYGHSTKWAAEAMLARVYLFYTGYYGSSDLVGLVSESDALSYVEDVIQNSGHDLVQNYYDLWPAASTYQAAKEGKPIDDNTYAGENNIEIVFSIKYTYTSDYDGNTDGNHWMVMNGLRGQSYPEYGYGNGWGACTVVPEFYEGWDEGDDRREASVMAIEQESMDYTEYTDVKEYTGYFTKKYIPLCDADGNSTAVNYGAVNFMIGQYQDYFVMRFSDVLLMAAELGSSNALEYVNRVRERAKVDPIGSVDKDVIYNERMYEFAFEGIRYWDLLRYDNTLQYAADRVTYSGPVLNGGVEQTLEISGSYLKTTRGLSQVPYNQITLSAGVLKQNTGW